MTDQDLLQNEIQEVGNYRVRPVAWTLQEYSSGAISLLFKLSIVSKWHPGEEAGTGEWSNEWPAGYYTENSTNIIKKDGTPNPIGSQGLAKAGLWYGDFDAIASAPPSVVLIAEVKENPHNGNIYYRADRLSPDADKPPVRGGGFKPVDQSVLDSMRARFGTQMKAIAGQAPASAAPAPAPPSMPSPGEAPF